MKGRIKFFKKFKFIFLVSIFFMLTASPLCAQDEWVEITPRVDVMPSLPDASNELRFTLKEAQDGVSGFVYCASGMGLLSDAQGLKAQKLSVELRPNEPMLLRYSYTGPDVKSRPIKETIIFATSGGKEFKAAFDVGIALEIADVVLLAEAAYGAPVPLQVRLKDRFHPKGNLAAWLALQNAHVLLRLDASSASPTGALVSSSGLLQGEIKADAGGWYFVSPQGSHGFITTQRGIVNLRIDGDLSVGASNSPIPLAASSVTVDAPPPAGIPGLMAEMLQKNAQIPQNLLASALGVTLSLPKDPIAAGSYIAPLIEDAAGDMRSRLDDAAISIIETVRDEKIASQLLQGVLKNYDKGSWVLIILKRAGVKALTVLAPDGKPVTMPGKQGENYRAMAFHNGQKPVIRITGDGTTEIFIQKIIPSGINTKIYSADTKTREITVHPAVTAPK